MNWGETLEQILDGKGSLSALFEQVPYWSEAPPLVHSVVLGLVPAILIVLAVVTPVGLLGVWAERRLSGKLQSRIGPNRVGLPFVKDYTGKPWFVKLTGLGQSLADGLKLLGKEDFVPPGGDKFLFMAAPLVVFAGALGLFAALPLSAGLTAVDLNVGIFYVLAVGAVEIVGVLMAGWASNNKWSLIGAMREVAQVVSYEIPMSLCVLCPVLLVGSLNLGDILEFQQAGLNLWGLELGGEAAGRWGAGWMVFQAFPFNVITFVIFYVCVLANLKRAPFDLPESESELVSGFLTEYSGMRWGLFFLGEYAAMFALSGISATLFLGGWSSGPAYGLLTMLGTPELIAGVVEFTWKTGLLFLLMIQIRWTLPRLRLDQVMSLCYKYFVPFAMGCLLFCGAAALMGRS